MCQKGGHNNVAGCDETRRSPDQQRELMEQVFQNHLYLAQAKMVIVAAATLSQDGQMVSLGSMCVVGSKTRTCSSEESSVDQMARSNHDPPYFSLVTGLRTRSWRGGGGDKSGSALRK